MIGDEGLSWREQLGRVRGHVVELQERRASDKRLERERNEQSLKRRLKEDTPDALNQTFNDIRRRSDRAARKFFPPQHIEAVLSDLSEFGDLLRFYADCMKSLAKVFSPAHKTTITSLLGDLGSLQRGLDRQLGQWRTVTSVTDKMVFRARQPSDDADLVAVAKAFSDRAHGVTLSIPNDFFAHENENFWVAECDGNALGYVKYWVEDKVVTFALFPPEKINFNKLVRGALYKFFMAGPAPEKMTAVRVRVGYVREVKFFTDIGFVRVQTKGPSDWLYERELD